MSESSKMGLFGSKDDNTETSDEKKQPVKSNETTQGHSAPYNIDSDSETYDTEALSIMDINDIIGIQAETAGDSTLESEIAALSEVITDIKSDEVALAIEKSLDTKKTVIGRSDTNRDIGSSKDKGSEKDSPKEDICSQADDNRFFDSAGMAGINKSLQLIGEAYISEDSQDTETDEIPDTTEPKSDTIGESITVSKDENAEATTKYSSETVASVDESSAPEEIIAEEKSTELDDAAVSNKSEEIATNPLEQDLKSMQIEKSADSTDSSAVEVLTKHFEEENKTECMDVDSAITENVAESVYVEKSSCNETEEIDNVEKAIVNSTIELAAVETENLGEEPVKKAEVPMEVDQPIDEVSEKVETEEAEPFITKVVIEDKSVSSDSAVMEETVKINETICQQEEIKKPVDEVFDNTKTSADNRVSKAETSKSGIEEVRGTKIIEEELHVPKAVEEEFNAPKIVEEKLKIPEIIEEELEVSKIVEEELKQSSSSPKGEEIIAEKLEMETDDSQVQQSIPEQVEANSCIANVTESIVEIEEQIHASAEGRQPETSTEKVKFAEEISPESLEQVVGTKRTDVTFIEHVATPDNEPMEVDDNALYHKSESDKKEVNSSDLPDNSVDTVEPVTDIVAALKKSEDDKLVDTAADSPVSSLESIVIAKIEALPDITAKDIAKNETIASPSKLSENYADIDESNIILKECAKDETSVASKLSENSAVFDEPLSNVALKEVAKDESSVASELSVNSAEIVESVLVVTPKESASDKSVLSELRPPEESSIIDEAMEIEDITLKESLKDELVVAELSEKSSGDMALASDVIRREISVVGNEEIALEDEKMEVDAGVKKKIQEVEESDICRPNEVSQETEESPVSTAEEVTVVEESPIIENAGDSDRTEDSKSTEKSVEDVRISKESATGESSEVEAIKRIDETDQARQNSKDEDNVELISIPQVETLNEKIQDIETTETPDNATTEVAEVEKEEIESMSKKEENEPLIAISQAESSIEKIHEIDAVETPDNSTAEEVEVENKKGQSESKEEENVPLTAIPQAKSPAEKINEIEATGNDMAELTEVDKEEAVSESMEVENLPLIAIPQAETPDEKIHEIESTGRSGNDMAEVTEDDKEEAVSESMEEENVPLISVPQDETSSTEKIHEIITEETPNNTVAELAENEKDEVKSELMEEEIKVLSKSSESSTEKSCVAEATNATDEPVSVNTGENESFKPGLKEAEPTISTEIAESPIDIISEVEAMETIDDGVEEKSTIKTRVEETESSISAEAAESSTDEIHEIETMVTPVEAMEEHIEKAKKTTQSKANEDETVVLVSIEKPEPLAESNEMKILEAPVETAGNNVKVERNESEAITKEEEKESPVSTEIPKPSTTSSEMKIAKSPETIIEDVIDAKEAAKSESQEISISTDNSSKSIPVIQSTEIADEAMITDVQEVEESISESKETEKKLNIATEITEIETPELPETDNLEKYAEESASTCEKETESQFEFPKPETPQLETSQIDLSSTSMNPEDAEDEEDPVEEEMNLSLDPDITECQDLGSREDDVDEPQRIGELSLEAMPVDSEQMEDQTDINLSLEADEKIEKMPSIRDEPLEKLTAEVSVDDFSITSAADKTEQSDERLEKSPENDDENSKDIMSTIACESEIFHDEQSQSTQEMMDSILETDSSNFNKILDDEEAEIDELADKLPLESEELLNKALNDPMASQNIDSLEGLLDLDLMQEGDESTSKSVDPIVAKVMKETEEDMETKDVDVSLLLEETDQIESADRDDYVNVAGDSSENTNVLPQVVEEEGKEIAAPIDNLLTKSDVNKLIDSPVNPQLETAASPLADNVIEAAFDLPVEPNLVEADELMPEDSKLELAEDILMEIAVDEEKKMELAGKLLLETTAEKDEKIDLPKDLLLETTVQIESKIDLPADLLLDTTVQEETKDILPADVLLTAAVEVESGMELVEEVLLESPVLEDPKLELSEDISMETVVRDQVLTAAAEVEDMPPSSEISELESAVKFLQESEEQDIDSPLVLSPKIDDSVVEEIARVEDVGIFVTDEDICEDPSELVAELENIIPDPIAISEAEIISEAVKLESEKKSKLSEEAKLESPVSTILEDRKEITESTPPPPPPPPVSQEVSITVVAHPETPKTHREPRDTVAKSPKPEKMEQAPLLKKSAPIPKISILEERLKEPPKIEIPSVSEVSRICEMPTTPKTSLLIQRDAKLSSFQKMLESPKATDKTELKIVDTPRKDADKHDFENVGSPRIILKIAKSAIADCAEPRSPKSPKIRSATNSPNPDDSPGQKLGKIKLKLSKGGHPSIISNENVEEVCGQWHTEGTSSLSPLGMKIKFSKTGDASIVQTEKHEPTDEAKEPPKHKFEEAKRTESPIGMKIKFSKTGDASIVQQDSKETLKHKDKLEIMQGSPKRNESPLGMKIKFSKSGDASIIQPEKSESSEDHRESSSRGKDKLDVPQDAPRRTESPLGMKFKLFKTGDASIVASEIVEDSTQETKRTESPLGMKIKLSKTRGSSSKATAESSEDAKERLEVPEIPRRTESPLGMKIKFSKTGDASIIHLDDTKETVKHKDRAETNQDTAQAPETPAAVKIRVTKSREASALHTDVSEEAEIVQTTQKRTESSIGMKFKLSKTGDASIVLSEKQEHVEDTKSKEKSESPPENSRKPDSAIGMKIKFSKTGDASIIQSQLPKKSEEPSEIEKEQQKTVESPMPMKIKLQKSIDVTKVESEKKEKSLRRKDTDSPLEMKIKLSKTGHPTIVACDNYGESSQRMKDTAESHKNKETTTLKEMPGMKMLKTMHSGIHGNRAELTIEPVQLQSKKSDVVSELSPKRKDVTISPVESKKAKLEAKLSQMLPEVTIQPIKPREQKQIMFDAKASSISRQQMNVISQEISITQVRSNKAMDLTMTNKLKSMLAKTATTSANPDCEIIEHRPELIIVNENSNSSQDVMIIEEVPALREPEVKVPKKRGRPRRNPLPVPLVPTKPIQQAMQTDSAMPRDPLAFDDVPQLASQTTMQYPTKIDPLSLPPKENERPKRSCSRQKSYAPPRRGRGRGGGRGKRKMEMEHMVMSKKPRIDQDLTLIEQSTTALITIDEPSPVVPENSHSTSELYKALRQPPMDHKMANAIARVEAEKAVNDADLLAKDTRESLMDSRIKSHLDGVIESSMKKPAKPAKSVELVEPAEPGEPAEPAEQHSETFDTERKMSLESLCSSDGQPSANLVTDQMEKAELMIIDDEKTGDEKIDDKTDEKAADEAKDIKDTASTQDHQNWLTPSSKKQLDGRNEGNISSVQVIDEETRMSAESSSRSQTPARNMTQAPETIVNEESQGSVLSTATTESEKVKVKNRRMEISFDPDEGPFSVDKIAEYEWPLDPTRKSETFMIQEQISQYLGVKSFKRKYPDLNRRMVDMEERNYLRENALVSEAMCDMGLTAVCSSEVLDVMCNDFPDQYEEYRKYIREKQMKEHSKKQKELTAAANAEKNRIDLAEMAVQSALSWNVGLNKARRESRKCSLDLQTFTIHVPKKQQKVEEESRQSHYPVALIPGQYTDYYREYTPAELRYYPLNTVLYGPMKPNERKLDSQSEGSQSDSDSDSSSDDTSSSSSDGTQDTEESQSTMDEVDVELSRQKEDIKSIKCKMCLKHLNKFSRTEVLIQCGTCNGYVHPSCIDLTLDMVPHIQAYAWQCTDCKTCAQCHDPADEDKMLFCDMCDRGYHIYCVGLRRVPQGRWHCQECAVCASCGSREAGGANSDRNSVAQWQHEYKKGDKNTRVYVSTLCVPCSKLWRKGRYCPHCSRCHTVPRLDLEANLVHCSACDKYLHLGCVETKDLTIDRKNYLCDFCQPSRPQMVKPLVSKVFRT